MEESLEKLRECRREMQFPSTENSMWIYQFAIPQEDGDKISFDFRAMHTPHTKDKELMATIGEEKEVPEDKDFVVNQVRGDPTIGEGNFFNDMKEVEKKIIEVIKGEAEDALPKEEYQEQLMQSLEEEEEE